MGCCCKSYVDSIQLSELANSDQTLVAPSAATYVGRVFVDRGFVVRSMGFYVDAVPTNTQVAIYDAAGDLVLAGPVVAAAPLGLSVVNLTAPFRLIAGLQYFLGLSTEGGTYRAVQAAGGVNLSSASYPAPANVAAAQNTVPWVFVSSKVY